MIWYPLCRVMHLLEPYVDVNTRFHLVGSEPSVRKAILFFVYRNMPVHRPSLASRPLAAGLARSHDGLMAGVGVTMRQQLTILGIRYYPGRCMEKLYQPSLPLHRLDWITANVCSNLIAPQHQWDIYLDWKPSAETGPSIHSHRTLLALALHLHSRVLDLMRPLHRSRDHPLPRTIYEPVDRLEQPARPCGFSQMIKKRPIPYVTTAHQTLRGRRRICCYLMQHPARTT